MTMALEALASLPPFLVDGMDPVPCRRAPALFMQEAGQRKADGAVLDAARRLCRECPVRRACAQYALDTYQLGVWGGTSAAERTVMRRKGVRRVA